MREKPDINRLWLSPRPPFAKSPRAADETAWLQAKRPTKREREKNPPPGRRKRGWLPRLESGGHSHLSPPRHAPALPWCPSVQSLLPSPLPLIPEGAGRRVRSRAERALQPEEGARPGTTEHVPSGACPQEAPRRRPRRSRGPRLLPPQAPTL